ncbi:unnamed protein product [Arabis nemorensis]|uniref:Ubiquitin-like domain-containing protein n=1 Tax=Arabis nemorensis TaxID=586526 RepID=A0A565AVQ2_9BRAS|nr:unnamed protein product [Arabis nemorensis]
MSMIDWHSSLEKDFANNEELSPPGTGMVSIVDVDGCELDIIEKTVLSLSENLASFKEKIAEEIQIPPEKQVLFGKAGLFEDNNRSLAHYNVEQEKSLLCPCVRVGERKGYEQALLLRGNVYQSKW